MRKNEYVKLFQEKAKREGLELKQKEVDVVLESLEELIVDIFKSGDEATIGGFLKIERKEIEASERKSTLPRNEGEIYTIPASTKPYVKLTKAFVKEHMILK